MNALLLIKYIFFCISAIFINLMFQRISLNYLSPDNFIFALLLGTFAGLISKFFLDRYFIFYDYDTNLLYGSRQFMLYSLNGVLTTFIFWSAETTGYLLYGSNIAREIGAIIGLSIGYFLKFKLDAQFVFNKL